MLLLLLVGCGPRGGDRPDRPAGSAIWVDPREASLSADAGRALRASGCDEVFLSVGALSTAGGTVALDRWDVDLRSAVPERTPATLAIVGAWPPETDVSPGRAAEALLPALTALRTDAEAAGLWPVGIHLHLAPRTGFGGESLESLAELTGELRDALAGDLFLSVSIHRDWLDRPELEPLLRSADFVVPFLYGDSPGAPDRQEAWDPERVAEDVTRVEALGVDYLIGTRILGSASHRAAGGEVLDVTTRVSLGALASNQDLRRSIGDAFGGVGRLVYVFQAQRRTRAAGWQLAPGDAIRVVGTAPALLHGLRSRLAEGASEHQLGLLFDRAPGPEERFTPAPTALAAVLGPDAPTPDLQGELVVDSTGQRTVILGIALENLSTLSTDLALGEGNYVSLTTQDAFVERVEPGDFARYSLWRGGREVRPGLGWREPDEVRLYTPMVAGGARVGGARVELGLRGEDAAAFLAGRFYLPDGQELDLEPTGGELSRIAGPGARSE